MKRLVRFFANKKNEEFLRKYDESLKKVYEEKVEAEKQDLEQALPKPVEETIPELKKEQKEVSIFGESEEEETTPFFLEDTSKVQYIYSPSKSLEFDQEGYTPIFESPSASKLRYCWRTFLPVGVATYMSLHPNVYGTLGIALAWSLPLLIYSRGLMVKSILLHQDGKHLKVRYKRFRFLPVREKVIDVKDFKEPSGNAFMFWSLYEMPDDLFTYIESQKMTQITFAKKWSLWSFFVLPKNAKTVNREVLVNALNGIYIDTENITEEEDLQNRYFVLYNKETKP
mmetsp:Transcript_14434/g.21063  ORF Transcript_14434/g.21063 Transcript_14434/m.21063 type:complete len:284 (+) Transcript_14434:343-1194(+)